jgi:hypothetical protein
MLNAFARAIGRGLIGGLLGTIAMTATTMLEMRLRDRPPSMAPAEAAEKVLDVRPDDAAAEERLSTLVHYAYGSGWGVVRGLLAELGGRGRIATLLHFGAVWGAAMVMLPNLRISPPPSEWGTEELVVDGTHHLVYATVTGMAVDALAGKGGPAVD